MSAARFRRLIDDLERDGLILEVVEASVGRREPRHSVVGVQHWGMEEWDTVLKVRGREDVLDRLGLTEEGLPLI